MCGPGNAACNNLAKHVGEEHSEEAVADAVEWIMVRMDLLVYYKSLFMSYYADNYGATSF
jgi:hypothetical protein